MSKIRTSKQQSSGTHLDRVKEVALPCAVSAHDDVVSGREGLYLALVAEAAEAIDHELLNVHYGEER